MDHFQKNKEVEKVSCFCHPKQVLKYGIFCCQLSQQVKMSSHQAAVYISSQHIKTLI